MPRVEDVIAVGESLLGTDEEPDGSNNAPPITTWYYGWSAAWCCMDDSYMLAHAGFSDDGGETLNLARLLGLTQTTDKGWAYCGYMREAFESVGRWSDEPKVGSFFILPGDVHTGLVSDLGGGTIEGNYRNHHVRGGRDWSRVAGFCHPPYDDTPAPAPPSQPGTPNDVPEFPGTTRRGSRGDAVLQVQQRLHDRGWTIGVDGDFGPQTDHVVRGFQADKGLEVDGIVGPITWTTLWTAPIT